MAKLPTTVEEAVAKFRAEYPREIADCLIGIFRCEIAMGKSVLEAYECTLRAHIKAAGIKI